MIFYNNHVNFVYVPFSITSHPQNEAPPVGWWRCFLLLPLDGGLADCVLTWVKLGVYGTPSYPKFHPGGGHNRPNHHPVAEQETAPPTDISRNINENFESIGCVLWKIHLISPT